MAIAQNIDNDTLNSIIKKSFIGIAPKENQEVIPGKSIVKVSNTITSLQNAFNSIYTYTLNVKNIHKVQERRLQNIKKEVTMETKTSTTPTLVGGMDFEIGNLPDVFRRLTTSVKDLTLQLDNLDMSGSACDTEIDIDIDRRRRRSRGTESIESIDDDDDNDSRKRRRRGGRAGRRGFGRALGVFGAVLDIADRVDEGQSAGQIAAGVGGGIAGGALGAKAGAALGAFGGPLAPVTVPLGALVGGALGYMGGSALGDKAYSVATNKGSQRRLETTATNVARQQARLENGQPLGATSYSSRFADYLRQSISNMSVWALAAGGMLAAGFGGFGGFDGGGASGFYGDGAGSTENAEKAMQYFMSQGWSREQAAGIVGNLQAESTPNLNPNAFGENDVRPGVHSYGIAQWNRGRWANLQAFAQSKNKPWNDFQTQLEFIQNELTGSHRRAGDLLRNARDAATAAEIVNRQYEVSADYTNRRAANAIALLQGGTALRTANGTIDRSAGGTGRLTSFYGMRNGRMHEGIDIAAPTGTPVAAAYGGVITTAGIVRGYGNVVYIDHGQGYSTRYGHLNSFAYGIRDGVRVNAGDIIGAVGSTGRSSGPHLHYELRTPNGATDPISSYRSKPWIVGGRIRSAAALTPPVLADIERRRANPDAWAGLPYLADTRNRDLPRSLGGQPPAPLTRNPHSENAFRNLQRR